MHVTSALDLARTKYMCTASMTTIPVQTRSLFSGYFLLSKDRSKVVKESGWLVAFKSFTEITKHQNGTRVDKSEVSCIAALESF